MPAAYTHYKFGQEVLFHLSNKKLREVIAHYPKMFDLGLYGPDILFYHGIPGKKELNYLGFSLHKEKAADFFVYAKDIIMEKNNPARGEGLAYILGAICHFVLDSECHSYIEYCIENKGLSHTEMEMDLERELLERDGYNPVSHNSVYIKLTKREAEYVAMFYEGVTGWQIGISLQHMKRVTGWLLPTNMVKRGTLHSLLGISGRYSMLKGLIMRSSANEKCETSTMELMRMFDGAISVAVTLMMNYYWYLLGRENLSQRFNRTYGPEREEMERIALFFVN